MKNSSPLMKKKRPKIKCEVETCEEYDKSVLHRHHICERTEFESTNDDFNIAILCANHHALVHAGKLKILGVLPGTKPPSGRILIYELNGICNVPGLNEEYFKNRRPKPKSMKWHGANEKKKA